MPRVKICDPSALTGGAGHKKEPARSGSKKQLEDKIIDMFGVCLTLADVMKVIGLRDQTCAKNWVASEGLEAVMVNGRRRYIAMDVAKALERSKIRAL